MNLTSRLIIFVAVLASLLEIIDTSIVNVAIPTMMGNLGATLEDVSMVVTGYTVANAIVLPLSAWLGERIGRRNYYLGCISIFTITSVACGLAPNLISLIIFRILQGLAGGALLPTSQALIYEQFPKEKAGIAGAIFGMSVMVGPTLGPVLGGYLTDNYGWRSIFNINLPIGILTLFLGVICIQDRTNGVKNKTDLDVFGLILLIFGVGCLQFLLERGQADDWFESKLITSACIISLVSLVTFVWWELRVKFPIINLRLFKEPIVVSGIILMSCLGFFYMELFLFYQYF
ncbi:DHA2 family efflux MFS transporter permease subunit [Silvanigrella sp.]|jgi:DHA2 family multidrug resistance protein|uniref:DHA2 family efflux MFS transporter permease subunit n=1 Tax=Silvanigrella sp. TaxID=2024976 RepID=UPI0037CC30AA